MKKLLIIDGTNLLCQMFFGMPSRIVNKDGKAIQGTLGFVGALRKIIIMTEPTHIIVLFDGEHENFRTELSNDYKANRIDNSDISEDENPFSQLPDVYAALDYMKIKHIESTGLFEADDIIASYALTHKKDIQVFISSQDSDFFQLISDNVFVLKYRGIKTVICDVAYIQDRYGIFPTQYADFKSLTGDNSDNIKGAEKVGLKTAKELINQFGNLENVIKQQQLIVKPSIKKSIESNAERLKINYKLIKLNANAEIPIALEELAYSFNGLTTSEVLIGIHLK